MSGDWPEVSAPGRGSAEFQPGGRAWSALGAAGLDQPGGSITGRCFPACPWHQPSGSPCQAAEPRQGWPLESWIPGALSDMVPLTPGPVRGKQTRFLPQGRARGR